MSVENIIFEKLMQEPDNAFFPVLPNKHNKLSSENENSDNAQAETGLWFAEISANIEVMERTRENYAFRHIYSCRRWIGGLIVFFKRAVRKLLKWYIEPICFQQTDFNNAVTPAIGRLTQLSSMLNQRTEQLELEKETIKTIAANKANADDLQALAEKSASINDLQALAEKSVSIDDLQKLEEENSQLKNQLTEMLASMEELRGMLSVNQANIEELEGDIECIRDIDISIFDRKKRDFFIKQTNSQSGEDSIIAYILLELGIQPKDVTYVDLGANHARIMNNTYYFYSLGASGVLVEANSSLIPELKLLRNRDTILNYCISDQYDEVVDFYILNGDGVSTAVKESAEHAVLINDNLEIVRTEKVRSITIQKILEDYVEPDSP